MPTLKVDINAKPYRNIDPMETNSQYADALIDGYINEIGDTVKRPGIDVTPWVDLGTGKKVDGLFWWDSKQMLIAVSDGKIFKITDASGTKVDITGLSTLENGNHVSFSEHNYGGSRNLYMANQSKINVTDGSTSAETTDPELSAIASCSGLSFLDGYIIAIEDGTNAYHYSSILTVPVDSGYFTKESKGDIGKTVIVDSGYIYVLGSTSSESWYNDGTTPFSRVGNAAMGVGIAAPDSAKAINGSIFFLSDTRKVIQMAAQQYQTLSTPFDREFQNMTTVTDAIGFNMLVDGKNFYVITFPTDNKTFVYNILDQYWMQWGKWSLNDYETLSYNRYFANDYVYIPTWGLHLIGSRFDGKIYKTGKDYYTDAGDPIRMLKRTGHDDNGTYLKKRVSAARLKVKTGTGLATSTTTPASFTIRWRDNGSSIWSNYHTVSLNAQGKTEFIKELKRLGQYQTRQWEICHAENSPFILCGMEIDADLLTR